MTPIPVTPATAALARRVVWFEEPAEALADPVRFMAYALEMATWEDIQALRAYVGDEGIRETLAAAPPGIIRPRSWAYWHGRMGISQVPPLPTRRLDGADT